MQTIERTDRKWRSPPVNCRGCSHREGKICRKKGAFILVNINFPTECEHWEKLNEE